MAAPLTGDHMDPVHLLDQKLQRVLQEREQILCTQRALFGEGRLLAKESSTLVRDCRLARESRLRVR